MSRLAVHGMEMPTEVLPMATEMAELVPMVVAMEVKASAARVKDVVVKEVVATTVVKKGEFNSTSSSSD
jgi:hypothetical protein